VAGWVYQFVARLNFIREKAGPPQSVCVARVRPPHQEEANAVATEQVEALLGRLEEGEAIPLFVFDAGYDPVKLQRALEGSACQISSACGRGVASAATLASAIRRGMSDALVATGRR
jgi:hypothetical protein